MRILLDECIDEKFRFEFGEHDCQTCRYAGFKGLTNGKLLAAAELSGFDVMITVDRNMPHQQNVRGRALSIVVIESRSTDIDNLLALLPEILSELNRLKPGSIVRVSNRKLT